MAAGVSDGALIIDTGIDNSGVIRDARQYERCVNGLKNTVARVGRDMAQAGNGFIQSTQRQTREVRALETQMRKLESEAKRLERSLSGDGNYSDEYKRIGAEIQQLEEKITALQAKQQEWADMGISPDTAPFEELDQQILETIDKIDALKAAQEQMLSAGTAYTGDYQDRVQQLEDVRARIDEVRAAIEQANAASQNATEAANVNLNGIKTSFKNVLKYGLGIRSVFVLFNRLRSAAREGFSMVSEQNPRLAASMERISNALTTLKAGLAVAFTPIFTAVEPALTTMINLLGKAFNAIAMVTAALTGQHSYYGISNAISNAGEAAAETRAEVNALNRQLAKFDDLNILSSKGAGGGTSGGSGGSGGGVAPFSLVEIPLEGFWDKLASFTEGLPDWLKWLFGIGGTGLAAGAGFLFIKKFLPWLTKKVKDLFALVEPDWLKRLLGGGSGADTGSQPVEIDLTEGDWSLLERLKQLTFPVKLTPSFSLTADQLFNAFEAAWEGQRAPNANAEANRGGRILKFMPAFTTTANQLFEYFKAAWDAGDRQLTATITANIEKGEWDATAWLAACMTSSTFTRTIKSVVEKGAWDATAWLAASMTSATFTRTIISAVQKGAWDATAWLASSMTSMSITRTITSVVQRGTWDATAWLAASMTSSAFTRTITSVAQKGAWDATAWLAANMTTYTITRTIRSVAEKGAWDATAWLAANLTTYTAIRTAKATVEKAKWDEEAWTAATMEDGSIERTITIDLEKGDWGTVSDYLDAHFGGASGGGGKTSGGGAGRYRVQVDPTLDDATWQQQWDEFAGKPFEVQAQPELVDNSGTLAAQYAGSWKKAEKNPDNALNVAPTLLDNAQDMLSKLVRWWNRDRKAEGNTLGVSATVEDNFGSIWKNIIRWWRREKEANDGKLDMAATITDTSKSWWASIVRWFNKGKKAPQNSLEMTADVKNTSGNWWGDIKNWFAKEGKNWWNKLEMSVEVKNEASTWWDNVVKWWNGIKRTLGFSVAAQGGSFAAGGYVTNAGRMGAFASGGAVTGSGATWFDSVRKYAAGPGRAHGTVFVAGESGPEIVGHVNGRTEILNKSQLAQTMYAAIVAGMGQAVDALGRYLANQMVYCTNALITHIGGLNVSGIEYHAPAMASGAVLPYDIAAQIARTGESIERTLNDNNEDLIQTIISVSAQLAAVMRAGQTAPAGGGGASAQQLIDEINRRTQMFGTSPIMGV